MHSRPRRLRSSASIREMVEETRLSPAQMILPLFLVEGEKQRQPIISMPGQFRLSLDEILKLAEEALKLGIRGIVLFPVIKDENKNRDCRLAFDENSFYLKAISKVKKELPSLLVMTDVALDPYSSDGHDGLVDHATGKILNDETVELLVRMSLAQAHAGADIIGPSDMMDGRVGAIRHALEHHRFIDTMIMSYSAKYASAFYGPFRDALSSAPKFGDKKSYQMNPANRLEAIKEATLDAQEGADILMVKPALSYLDVIREIKNCSSLPVAAYNVSGEYAMVKAAAMQGWLDERRAMMEMLISMRRAGADLILTYFALDAAKHLKES